MFKYFLGAFSVCILCGCLSVEVQENKDTIFAREAPAEAEPMGDVFVWNSESYPFNEPLGVDASVYSGYNGIYFSVCGNTNGKISVIDGAFRMGGEDGSVDERLVIGSIQTAATTPIKHTPGQFNISQGAYMLTIDYRDPVRTSGYMLRISINNNTTGGANSVVSGSNVRQFTNAASLEMETMYGDGDKIPGRISLRINPVLLVADSDPEGKESLKNAFFTLICQSRSGITITGIKIERIE